MQRLEVSVAVRPLKWSLDVKGLSRTSGYVHNIRVFGEVDFFLKCTSCISIFENYKQFYNKTVLCSANRNTKYVLKMLKKKLAPIKVTRVN